MPAYTATLEEAQQEIAEVENALIDGYPAHTLLGSHTMTAIRVAADKLGIIPQSFKQRVGTPERPRGSHFRHYGLEVDWSLNTEDKRDDTDLLKQTVELYKLHGSMAGAAKAIGIPDATFQDRIHRAARKGLAGFKPVLPGFEIKRTSTVLGPEGEVQREYVTQKPEAGEPFDVPDGQKVKGVSALVDPDGRVINQWIKTGEDREATVALLRTIADELKQDLPKIKPSKGPAQANALLLNQYTVTDLHFGMRAWADETRNADYDLKIAEKLLLDWFSAAIAMAPDAAVGILAQLGDLLHYDSLEAVTPTSRNVLDADSRLQKMIRVVVRVIRQVIAMLLDRHEHVHVIMASANHDPASSAWLREMLHAMYETEPRISIDNSPDVYYAYEWGSTALFYHHGHRRKLADVDSVFAGKFRELYGRADHSYGHIGHLHSDGVVESNLMRIERHRTLAPPDAHASSNGWLAKRDAKVITYHREFGEVSRITLSPQMVQA